METRAQKVHHYDVVIAIHAGPVYVWDALGVIEQLVHLDFVRQKGRKSGIDGNWMSLYSDAQAGKYVECLPDIP